MSADVVQRFRDSLKSHRQAAGMSFADLARGLGMPRQATWRMENGSHEPLLTTANDVAAFFGKGIGEFLGETAIIPVDKSGEGH